tara:strand:+ start:325 stop:597 length:273 start_codon:yes stop_codon:yes gene_type:complete
MTLLLVVPVEEHLVVTQVMLEEEVEAEHNLQVVRVGQFKIVELMDLRFKEDLVPVVAEVDTSVVEAEVEMVVVVPMVLVEVVLLILVHHF